MRFAGDAMNPGAGLFSSASKSAPDYTNLAFTAMNERSKEKQSSMFSGAKVAGAGINSIGAAMAGQNEAEAIIAGGEAKASATQANAMSSMIGDIGGGIMGAFKPKFNYGKTKMGAGGGVVGGYGTLGPNYGFKQY